jgi:hypothetical protein
MSKVNQIQTELQSIDSGSFQKLCDLYLMQNPRYANLKTIGSVVGKDKTKTGVPDSLITLPDGTFAFAHYTTQKSGLPGKLKGDFDSSFDETHTSVPVDQIKEIVLCHNGTLDTKDELSLLNEGRRRGVTVTFRGLEKMAYDLFDKYPGLAREFLHVEVDSGQIVTPQEFVSQYGKSSFSTRLDTTFHFREEELKRILAALDTTDLVLITGGAGVGKSRLMLEAAHRYSTANEGWTVWCVFNRGVDLSQDLKVYFKRPGKYLILVDDANRLSGFEYILRLFHDQTSEVQVKIIATVRYYARDRILEHTKPFGGGYEEQLQPFTDDQIRTLISEEEGIKNYHFATRIVDVARGNTRLAMMAAKLAVEHQTLESISDVTSLYDEYFGSVRKVLEESGDEKMIKVAGIVAFFRVVDRSNHEVMDAIAEAFDMPPSAFWHAVEQLDRLELLDLYEHEVAKFSDQVLATYLLYFAVFKSDTLDFSIFLDRFFPRYRSLFIDALNPVINSLGARIEDQLRPHIDRKWKALEGEGREEDLIALIQAFWFVRETETLLYIRQEAQKLPYEQVELDALNFRSDSGLESIPLLDLLGVFYGSSHFSSALELVLEIFAKQPRSVGKVLRILKNQFGFSPESSLVEFGPQQEVVDRLWRRADSGYNLPFAKLFLSMAAHYLRTQFEVTTHKKMSVSWVRFDLPPTPTAYSLRQCIWEHVFELYSVAELQGEVLSLLHDYRHSGHQVSGHDILSKDSEAVIPFLVATLDPNNFKHASEVHDYLDMLEREEIAYDPAVRVRFTNQTTNIAALLHLQRFYKEGSIEDAKTRQEEALRGYVSGFTVDNYKQLLNQCVEIADATRDSNAWGLRQGIEAIFAILEDQGPDTYMRVVIYYLEMGAPLGLSGYQVAEALIKLNGVAAAYETINSREYPNRRRWLFAFFARIPPDKVDRSRLEQLYELYRTASPYDLPNDFKLLERYTKLDERVVVRVVEIFLSRTEAEKESGFASPLGSLFNPYIQSSEALLSSFGPENIALLKKAYLAARKAQDTSDHDGRSFCLILDLDKAFLREYITLLVEIAKKQNRRWLNRFDDSRNLGFLWKREDYEPVMRDTLQFLFEVQQRGEVQVDSFLEALFGTDRAAKLEDGTVDRQTNLLGKLIEERSDESDFMHFIFEVVGSLPDDRRQHLLAIFLSRNKRVEDFKRLSLERRSRVIPGSSVPCDQKRVEFIESLLPLVEGLDFLDHNFHLEKQIEALQHFIEVEKRRDFMREL